MATMIDVEGLKAWYLRGRLVLDGVTFQVGQGEVVALLGENGAGKTTLLRILSGLHHPQSGRAAIAGYDLSRDRAAAQGSLGYLPEEAAFDGEFRVSEFLQQRAAIKGVAARGRSSRVTEVLAQVGLAHAGRQLIGQLSKGYRQRLGLADALLADPQVLLLDEPTDGLDPTQRAQTLQLIAALAQRHTVLLSTHVLPEAELICQRALILDAGRIVAGGTPTELTAGLAIADHIVLRCRGDQDALLTALSGVVGVASVSAAPDGAMPDAAEPSAAAGAVLRMNIELLPDHPQRTVDRIARSVLEIGELYSLTPQRRSLDVLFRHLTRKVA